MKSYTVMNEDATWRQAFDAINETSQNLNDVDFLYKSYLGNGQVFDAVGNVGYVNNQEAFRNTNIVITKDNIASFKISGFKCYYRKENKIIDIDIDCNLYNYRDNRVHFLYLVLSQHGKYEVRETMFENTDELMLFARFVVNTTGDSVHFYVIAPFAGSPDYIKGNTFYDVSEGFNLEFFNKETRQMTISQNSKVSFSGINFDDETSPDVLHVDPGLTNLPIRYIHWDSLFAFPRVDWSIKGVNSFDLGKIMNYENGYIEDIEDNLFTCQKIYYDVYTNSLVAMYGNRTYPTMQEAILGVDAILKYPKPDNIDYLLPIAVVIASNTQAIVTEENFKSIGLKFDETEIFDSNDLARQQSAEAIEKAEEAITIAEGVITNVNNHASNKSNPHSVTATQVGLGNVGNYGIATEAEAELAAINTKYMTPLRTLDTIEANSVVTSGNIILKIQSTQPAAVSGKTVIWIDTSS